jgi:hypothetical protein
MRKIILAVSAMLMIAVKAEAGEPGQPRYDCPTVYHTWQSTHIQGRFEWEEIGSRFTIKVEKESATMTWRDGKKITFKRKYKPIEQTDYDFVGTSKNNSIIQISIDTEYEDNRPDDECRAYISYEKPNGADIRYLAISIE